MSLEVLFNYEGKTISLQLTRDIKFSEVASIFYNEMDLDVDEDELGFLFENRA